jgi:type IV secretion system protein VirB6
MDHSLPVTWLVGRIHDTLLTSAIAAAKIIAVEIMPLVAICYMIYMILMTLNYMRGSEDVPVVDFTLRLASWAIIIGFGLNADTYASTVIPIVTGVGADLANAITGGDSTAGAIDKMIVSLLKSINAATMELDGLDLFDGATAYLMVAFKIVLILIGYIPLLIAAAIAIVIASSGSILVAAVGPIFFGFALFPATRQYFSSWLNTVLSLMLVPIFVAIVALAAINIANEILLDATFPTLFIGVICNLILMVLIRQVSVLASSLSAGGINMAMPKGGIGSAASSIRSGAQTTMQAGKGVASGYRGAKNVGRAIANKFNSIRRPG